MGPVSFYLEGVRKKEVESPRLALWGEGGELRSGFLVLIKGEAEVDLNGYLDTYIDRITNSVIVAIPVLILIKIIPDPFHYIGSCSSLVVSSYDSKKRNLSMFSAIA